MTTQVLDAVLRWHGDVIACERITDQRAVVVGVAPFDVPVAPWTLVSPSSTGWNVRADPRNEATPLVEPVAVVLGAFTLELHVSPRTRRAAAPSRFDLAWANTIVVSLCATIASLAFVSLVPVDDDAWRDPPLPTQPRWQRLVLKPPPPVRATAAAAPSPPSSTRARTTPQIATKARAHAAQVAAAASAAVAAVIGDGGGAPIVQALGSIAGSRSADARLGLRGSGVGSQVGIVTVGIGSITRARGDVGRDGTGGVDLTARTERDVVVAGESEPLVTGALDKELIRRIVREHQAQVRYCYERALVASPGLSGKVTMAWRIDASGRVLHARASESQLTDGAVASCLASKIATWVFPKPKGGGVVDVSYPFVFKRAG